MGRSRVNTHRERHFNRREALNVGGFGFDPRGGCPEWTLFESVAEKEGPGSDGKLVGIDWLDEKVVRAADLRGGPGFKIVEGCDEEDGGVLVIHQATNS
jgi:hypothetical protein